MVRWSVCPWQDLPPTPTPKLPPPPYKHDFWAAQAILSNFRFWKKKIDTHLKIFFHPSISSFHLYQGFLSRSKQKKSLKSSKKASGFPVTKAFLMILSTNTLLKKQPSSSLHFGPKIPRPLSVWKSKTQMQEETFVLSSQLFCSFLERIWTNTIIRVMSGVEVTKSTLLCLLNQIPLCSSCTFTSLWRSTLMNTPQNLICIIKEIT